MSLLALGRPLGEATRSVFWEAVLRPTAAGHTPSLRGVGGIWWHPHRYQVGSSAAPLPGPQPRPFPARARPRGLFSGLLSPGAWPMAGGPWPLTLSLVLTPGRGCAVGRARAPTVPDPEHSIRRGPRPQRRPRLRATCQSGTCQGKIPVPRPGSGPLGRSGWEEGGQAGGAVRLQGPGPHRELRAPRPWKTALSFANDDRLSFLCAQP